ncbi:hypothetical protein L0337_34335 [candidate division KSB1 bacterium]|nr:hypothetical protein [candidate division KSB1 bacterium]
MLPTEILKQLQPLARDSAKNALTAWRKSHEEKLARFSKILERLFEKLKGLPVQKDLYLNAWQELDGAFKKYLAWTKDLQDVAEDSPTGALWEEWRQQFAEILQQFPGQAEITIPENYWERQAGDPLRVRWWRWKNRRQQTLRRMALSIRNGMRRLFRQPPLSSPLLHHETLTAEQHALVFHQDVQRSALLLNRLQSKGILITTANGYVIHPLLYHSMVRVLKTRNILH